MFGLFRRNPEVVVTDPARVLGIPKGSDQATIKRAYRQRSLETHPDRGGNAVEFMKVSKAYQMAKAGIWGPQQQVELDRAAKTKLSSDARRQANDLFDIIGAMKRARNHGNTTQARRFAQDALSKLSKVQAAAKKAFEGKAISGSDYISYVQLMGAADEAARAVIDEPKRAATPPPPPPPRRSAPRAKAAPPPPPRRGPQLQPVLAGFQKAERFYNEGRELLAAGKVGKAKRKANAAHRNFGKAWKQFRQIDESQTRTIKPNVVKLFDLIKRLQAAVAQSAAGGF